MRCVNILAFSFTFVEYEQFLLQDLYHCCLETAVMGESALCHTLHLKTDIHQPQTLKWTWTVVMVTISIHNVHK